MMPACTETVVPRQDEAEELDDQLPDGCPACYTNKV